MTNTVDYLKKNSCVKVMLLFNQGHSDENVSPVEWSIVLLLMSFTTLQEGISTLIPLRPSSQFLTQTTLVTRIL